MDALLGTFRTGDWLTRERMRIWSVSVLALCAAAIILVVAFSDGLNDFQGRPLGSDFSNVYAAGTYVLEGRAPEAFHWPAQFAREKAIFGEGTQFYGWHYPPFFLFVAGALATMPYLVALVVWQVVTLLLYLLTIRMILSSPSPLWGEGRGEGKSHYRESYSPSPGAFGADHSPVGRSEASKGLQNSHWLLLALGFPAVFVNIGHGHNGFLTAALIGYALVMLDRRPVLAGICFGLLSYKPQFGLLIPLVLIASGRWRAFFAATATVGLLIVVTTAVFGTEVWQTFFVSTPLTRVVVLEDGATGWHKIQTVFAWVRMWGGDVPLAYAAQGAVTIAVAGALIWIWRSDAAYPLKAAALAIGTLLATPYGLDYDMMVLAPAIAFLAADGLSRGFAPWEKSALALLWLVPLIARAIAEIALIPLGVLAMLLVFVLVLWRAVSDTAIFTRSAPLPSR